MISFPPVKGLSYYSLSLEDKLQLCREYLSKMQSYQLHFSGFGLGFIIRKMEQSNDAIFGESTHVFFQDTVGGVTKELIGNGIETDGFDEKLYFNFDGILMVRKVIRRGPIYWMEGGPWRDIDEIERPYLGKIGRGGWSREKIDVEMERSTSYISMDGKVYRLRLYKKDIEILDKLGITITKFTLGVTEDLRLLISLHLVRIIGPYKREIEQLESMIHHSKRQY